MVIERDDIVQGAGIHGLELDEHFLETVRERLTAEDERQASELPFET